MYGEKKIWNGRQQPTSKRTTYNVLFGYIHIHHRRERFEKLWKNQYFTTIVVAAAATTVGIRACINLILPMWNRSIWILVSMCRFDIHETKNKNKMRYEFVLAGEAKL